jgi:hypothetical protein
LYIWQTDHALLNFTLKTSDVIYFRHNPEKL